MGNKSDLKHVAFIMDGNGRWAKARNLPRFLGHKEGCERVIEIYEECRAQNIEVMSLYAFSTENWNRPKSEINHLFSYLDLFFKKEIERLYREGCRVLVSGDISPLPSKTKNTILKAIERTKDCHDFVFNICLNYGGKAEIIRACKNIATRVKENDLALDDINEQVFESFLYTNGLPNVDLLIRTSGEERISNFMPWQLAYAEFIFVSTPWPDFKKDEFRKCLEQFKLRNRRFGGIKDEKKSN